VLIDVVLDFLVLLLLRIIKVHIHLLHHPVEGVQTRG
jgi:hypothetical protein